MKRNIFIKTLIGLPFVLGSLSFKSKRSSGLTSFTPEKLTRHNFGLYIINNRVPDFEALKRNPSYAATVSWKLGYNNQNRNGRYGMINFLTDGWFCPIGNTYEDICEYLNNNPYGNTFRIMTVEEVTYLLTHRTQGFL